jgi:hypothetical protein
MKTTIVLFIAILGFLTACNDTPTGGGDFETDNSVIAYFEVSQIYTGHSVVLGGFHVTSTAIVSGEFDTEDSLVTIGTTKPQRTIGFAIQGYGDSIFIDVDDTNFVYTGGTIPVTLICNNTYKIDYKLE